MRAKKRRKKAGVINQRMKCKLKKRVAGPRRAVLRGVDAIKGCTPGRKKKERRLGRQGRHPHE